ncbi:MAG: hypothetical protein H7839_18325 [Magnetococcus sp. YQC-5]
MMRAYEAEIDAKGQLRFLEPIQLHAPYRAVVTVLETKIWTKIWGQYIHFFDAGQYR